jgi:peptide/nickel transport system substrate-binding protein
LKFHWYLGLAATALVWPLFGATDDLLVDRRAGGHPGGKLVYAQRTEPKTLNPFLVADNASKEVLHRMMADLIHINRETQQTEPALAKSWTVSRDGLRYVVELRQGLRFSDGQACDADDVVFSFQLYLDEKVHALQRDLLFVDGKPIEVRKADPQHVEFILPKPYAAAERLFDSFFILPRHLLERPYREGRLTEIWNLRTPPGEIAGLGPLRLKEYVPGQRIVLERNPYYWKADAAGNRLPYLSEVDFVFAGTENMQVMRFQSGESDVLSRASAKNYAALEKDAARRGYELHNLGPGLEYTFLVFNLNDLPKTAPQSILTHQEFFRRRAFRVAVSAAIDRDAIVRLAYAGYATALAGPVPPGNKAWIDTKLAHPVRSMARAKEALSSDGFKWASDGSLLDPEGRRVEFTIVTSSSNPERIQTAGLIQDDLKPLGIRAEVVQLEFRSLLDRLQRTHEFDVCLLSLASADADPNADMNVWLSSGATHLWHPQQKMPSTPWEAEIDGLMHRQIAARKYAERKQMFDRVQELLAENLPIIPLVSPDILVGARRDLGGFRPGLLDHYTLWNIEELYWRAPAGATPKR